jgi:hypothetical protein
MQRVTTMAEENQMTFSVFKEPISSDHYQLALRECDGFCATCGEWKPGGAEPMAESIYCNECENRTVLGVKKARELGVLEVEG